MERDEYLERIGCAPGTPPPLADLHERHLLAVPFENLDIHAGRTIVLEEQALLDKIVRRRRGGFCYELNGVFAWLLRQLGMRVSLLAAQGAQGDGWGIPFDHMTLRVDLERSWVADVGFGSGAFRYPLPLDGETVRQMGRRFRVRRDDEWHYVEADEKPIYRFTLQAYELADFTPGCDYHQTSPESPFPQRRMCSIALPGGRLTLTEDKLIETRKGERVEAPVEDFESVLRDRFGL